MNLEELCALGLDEDAAGRVLALHGRALEDQRDRYEAQAAALQGELEAHRRAEATRRAAEGLRFSSDSARRCFFTDLEQAALPLTEDGALAGFAAFAEEFCCRDPAALRGPDSMPLFVLPGGGMTAGEDETLRRAFGL